MLNSFTHLCILLQWLTPPWIQSPNWVLSVHPLGAAYVCQWVRTTQTTQAPCLSRNSVHEPGKRCSGQVAGMPWQCARAVGVPAQRPFQWNGHALCPCPLSLFMRSMAGMRAKALYRSVLHGAPHPSLSLSPFPTAAPPSASLLGPGLVLSVHPVQVSAFAGPTPSLRLFYGWRLSSLSVSSTPFQRAINGSARGNPIKVSRMIDSFFSPMSFCLKCRAEPPMASFSLDRTCVGLTGQAGLSHTTQASRGLGCPPTQTCKQTEEPNFLSWKIHL